MDRKNAEEMDFEKQIAEEEISGYGVTRVPDKYRKIRKFRYTKVRDVRDQTKHAQAAKLP